MDLSNIQFDVAQALGVVVATAVAFLARKGWVYLTRLVGKNNLEALERAAPHAVHAAEELAHRLAKVSESISGEEKMAFAKARLRDLVKLAGLKLSDEQLETIIEGTLNQARAYMDLPDEVSNEAPRQPFVEAGSGA